MGVQVQLLLTVVEVYSMLESAWQNPGFLRSGGGQGNNRDFLQPLLGE